MKADLEIVCGFIEAGKTAFINALNELTKIDDEKALVILTEDGHSKIEANSKEYKLSSLTNKNSLQRADTSPLSIEEIAAGVRELPYIKQRYTRIRIFHFHFFMNVFMNSPLRKFRFHLLHGSHALMPHGPVPEPYAQSLRRMVRKHFPVSP